MNAQDLKNSILQLAVQGKLVEQRAEEGTARELLEQINLKKDQLIKDKKIKKEKNIEYISDYPFDIPETWIWARLGDILYSKSGLSYKKGDLDNSTNNMVRVLRGGNIQDLHYVIKADDVQIDRCCVKEELYLKRNMLITPAVTSLEHIGKMARIDRDMDSTVVGGFVLMLIPYISIDILAKYMLYALSSYYHRKQCRGITNKSGQAFYNLSREKLMNFVIPIPPLEEQQRIVAKIEEILPYIDQYDKAYTKLETFNKKFPEDMKKSILQMAMQGKLVEQRPEEGTADELYEQIVAEKTQLIKEGKIKKEKPLPEITKDEFPFEIPSSWKWVRFGDFGSYKKGPFGSALTKSIFVPKGDDTIKVYEQKNAIQKDASLGEYYITRDYFESKMKGFEVFPGDIIVSCAGTIGETYIMPEEIEQGIINQALMRMQLMPSVYAEYFLIYFDVILKQTARKSSKGSAIKNIPPFDELKSYLVPLPPLAEQKRVVAKIEELLPYCDQLIK